MGRVIGALLLTVLLLTGSAREEPPAGWEEGTSAAGADRAEIWTEGSS